jgi:myosin heavy subunit
MEESKSLANFQVAGLMIQNAFRFLIAAIQSYNKKRLLKSYSVWRHKMLYIPKLRETKIKNSVIVLNSKLNRFYKVLQFRTRLNVQDTFLRVLASYKSQEHEKKLLKEEEKIKNYHQQELQGLTKDLKNLHSHQEDLEKTLKKMKNAEENYKNQINEMSGKKNEAGKNRKKNIKDREEEILDRIEELKEENEDIQEKITLIENNVNNFINEMSSLLEHSEELEKTNEKRRTSAKKGKATKKPRGFTLDIGKN